MNDIVIESFKNIVTKIYKLTNKYDEFLLVVPNDSADDDIYDVYIKTLDNNDDIYFEIRIIYEEELGGFLYLKSEQIY